MQNNAELSYSIRRTKRVPELEGRWNGAVWTNAATLSISNFRPESSDHRPETQAKLLYDDNAIYVIFRVKDRYVRCIHTHYLDMVCEDSCVEWFVQPIGGKGYFNFEMNCGGTLHCSYIEDSTRTPDGFKKFEYLASDLGKSIKRYHSMPKVVAPEISNPVDWIIEYVVPLNLFEHYIGKLRTLSDQQWRGNFFKCGDKTSHCHWSSWAKVRELNFHQPRDFGLLDFK